MTVSGDCGTNTSPPQQITVNPQLHKSNLTFPSGFYYGSSGSYKYKKLIDFGSNYAYWEYTTTYNPTSRKAEYPSYKTDTYEAVNSAYTLYLQPYNQYYRKSASEVYRLNRWVWNGNTYTGDLFPVPDNTFVEGLSMYYDLEDTFELDFAHPLDGEEVPLGLYRVEVHATGPGVTTSNVYLILPDGSSYKMTYNSSGAYYEYYWDTNPNAGQTVTLTAEVRSTTPYPQTTVTVIVACTPPTASFTVNPETGYAPLTAVFTDTSSGDHSSVAWDFGDGTTGTGSPVTHEYENPDTYTATMTVSGSCGSDIATKTIIAIRYPGFTVESWIRWTSTPNPGSDSTRQWATIVVDGNTDNNRRYHLQHDQTNAHFEFVVATVAGGGSGTWIFSTTSPVINTWYYVTGVYNQVTGIMAIYVNGVQQASRNIGTSGLRVSPGIYQVGGPSGINWGGSSGQRIFDGDTSGLATYEYVLTTAEIQAHYAAGHS